MYNQLINSIYSKFINNNSHHNNKICKSRNYNMSEIKQYKNYNYNYK